MDVPRCTASPMRNHANGEVMGKCWPDQKLAPRTSVGMNSASRSVQAMSSSATTPPAPFGMLSASSQPAITVAPTRGEPR